MYWNPSYQDSVYGWRAELTCKTVYQKAGFYFSLLNKIKSSKVGYNNVVEHESLYLDMGFIQKVKYQVKCDAERPLSIDNVFEYNTNYVRRRPYEGTRGLNKYWMETNYKVLTKDWNFGQFPGDLYLTRLFEVKWGY